MGSGLRKCQLDIHTNIPDCANVYSRIDGKCASKYVKVHVLVWQWQSCEREKGNCRSAHLQDHSGETDRESSRYTFQPNIFRRSSLPPTASPLSQSRYLMFIHWREPLKLILIWNISVRKHNRKAGRVPDLSWLLGAQRTWVNDYVINWYVILDSKHTSTWPKTKGFPRILQSLGIFAFFYMVCVVLCITSYLLMDFLSR